MIVIYCSTYGLRFFIWYPRYCSAVRAPEGVQKRETNVSRFFCLVAELYAPTQYRRKMFCERAPSITAYTASSLHTTNMRVGFCLPAYLLRAKFRLIWQNPYNNSGVFIPQLPHYSLSGCFDAIIVVWQIT